MKIKRKKRIPRKQYTSLIISVKSINYTDLSSDVACSRNLIGHYYSHFDFSKTGNVYEKIRPFDYKANQGLTTADFNKIKNELNHHYDVVNFLIADPRELLKNWMQWRDIFNMIPSSVRKYSYIIPYERHFKVDYIFESLNSINHASTFGQYIKKLPATGLPNHDSAVKTFNDYCNLANRDFKAGGSTVPLHYRY